MKKIIIGIFCMCVMCSCKYIFAPSGLKYRYSTTNFLTDSLFDMDGYYQGEIYYTIDNKINTTYITLLLYRDGTCATTFTSNIIDSVVMKRWNNEYGQGADKGLFRWGAYIVDNDIVKAQSLEQMYAWNYWMYTSVYKIIDRKTLVRVPAVLEYKNSSGIINYSTNDTLSFVPYANRPDSACYLKKYRWFKQKERKQ